MAAGVKVDHRAVIAGATVAVAVATVAIVLSQAISSLAGADADLPLYFVLLGGLAAGGRVAALRQPRSPLTHGALAAITGFLVVIAVIVVIRLALGREMADPVSLVFHLLMASSAGIFGGYLATRRAGPGADPGPAS